MYKINDLFNGCFFRANYPNSEDFVWFQAINSNFDEKTYNYFPAFGSVSDEYLSEITEEINSDSGLNNFEISVIQSPEDFYDQYSKFINKNNIVDSDYSISKIKSDNLEIINKRISNLTRIVNKNLSNYYRSLRELEDANYYKRMINMNKDFYYVDVEVNGKVITYMIKNYSDEFDFDVNDFVLIEREKKQLQGIAKSKTYKSKSYILDSEILY